MELKPYLLKVRYYETDKMGIVHHSNFIRWLEEARLDWLEQLGISFADLEKRGVVSPVMAVSCQYKRPVFYGDTVKIVAKVANYNGKTFDFIYELYNAASDKLLATGSTTHCFTNLEGRAASVNTLFPELHDLLIKLSGSAG